MSGDGFFDDLWERADSLEEAGMGDLASDIRHRLHEYDRSRCVQGHPIASCTCKANRILWNVEDEDIDEIVIHEPELVHVEQMGPRCWWIGIYLAGGGRWSGNFSCDSRGRMTFTEQDDDVDWAVVETHEADP